MRKLILTIAMAAAGFSLQFAIGAAHAADMGVVEGGASVATAECPRHRVCGPQGCSWQRFCRVGCPDGYSCAPLYGAYGPYGGTAYWGAYTDVGWGPRYYR